MEHKVFCTTTVSSYNLIVVLTGGFIGKQNIRKEQTKHMTLNCIAFVPLN